MKKIIVRQLGFSVVELLVALVLSGFIILGVSKVYLEHKKVYLLQQSYSAVIENSRFATLVLEDLLGKAGYRRSIAQPMHEAFPATTQLGKYCDGFVSESVVTKIKNKGDSQQVGFCLRYQPAYSGELVCDGSNAHVFHNVPFEPSGVNEIIYVAVLFTPHNDIADQGTLKCITDKGEMEILEGVADMRVEFGVSDDGSKILKKDQPFIMVTDWSEQDGIVRALRYSLLLASRKGQRNVDSNAFQYWLSSASSRVKARLKQQDDMNVYKIVRGGQALRNMMP